MLKKIRVYTQYLLPQQLITFLFGWLSRTNQPTIKRWLIQVFVKYYQVDLSIAQIEDPLLYPNFESFFIRHLKAQARPLDLQKNTIISPVDGTIASIGQIKINQLLQAKGQYFTLEKLLSSHDLAAPFTDGNFATLYLAPRDYHRIHMPLSGKLLSTTFIPGQLFSVNRMTADLIPNLYARNERLVCLFETEVGKMAIILVGAMIVGSMQVSWMDQAIKSKQILSMDYTHATPIELKQGEELGYFKMGSTVIVLFEKNKIEWSASCEAGKEVKYGQKIANFINEILN